MNERSDGADTAPKPLIVAAGFSPVPVLWWHVVRYYRRRGHDARSLPFRLADMRDTVTYAEHIAKVVRRNARDGRKTDIVGLSMGGVAALYAIKRLGIAGMVGTFIAVASPFDGSPLAAMGIPSLLFMRTAVQLRTGGEFLRDLHRDPLPEGPTYVALAGTKDAICPAHRALLPDARNIFIAFDHKALVLSRKLHRYVADLLSHETARH